MRRSIFMAVGLLCAVTAVPLAGCHSNPDGFTSTQQKAIDHVSEIAQRTGGDWAKTTPADKQFLIHGPGGGSEMTAKMILSAKAGTVSRSSTPGGAPK
jgi:hypothetical protein